jgi:hypothetical protein
MRVSRVITLIAPFALALTAAPAWAHGGDKAGPCRQDIQTLCPSVTPGPGSFRYCLGTLCPDMAPGPEGMMSCLQQHADKLSSACQEHLSQFQAKIGAWRAACQGDVQTFCSDVPKAPRSIGKCLRDHEDELSQTCKDLLAQHHGHHGCHHHHAATPTPGSGS